MRTIHESFSQNRLKMLNSMLLIIPAWLLTDWLGHPFTGYALDYWTPLPGIGDVCSIEVSRSSHDPAEQPAKHQKLNSLLDCLNA